MKEISSYIIPFFVALTVAFGLYHRNSVFHSFTEGAKEGIITSFSVLPTMIALIVAISVFKASGGLELVIRLIQPIAKLIGIPPEVLPLGILRPISGSGAIALTSSVFKEYSPNSIIGKIAGVMFGSSETTFYAVAVYFGALGIKKGGYTIPIALLGDLAVILFSSWAVASFS